MNFRLVAASMVIGLFCTIALYLFAPHTGAKPRTDAEYRQAVSALIKRPGAIDKWLDGCMPLFAPLPTAAAEDICRRMLTVLADGRLKMSEIYDHKDALAVAVIENAERRPLPVNRP